MAPRVPGGGLNRRRATGVVLAINAGSSSLKFAVFTAGAPRELLRGTLADLGEGGHVRARAPGAPPLERRWPRRTARAQVMRAWLEWLESELGGALGAVVHRVVHGGARFVEPVRLTRGTLAQLHALTPLDPLHQPRSLEAVAAVRAWRPRLPQVACFDTAFHASLRPPASRYGLPAWVERKGVRRYGFHGLSYESIAAQLRARWPGLYRQRVIVAHLGSGASLCAMRGGRSVDTTMGFSTLDGLLMGTRCGALDPGIVLYLQRELGVRGRAIERLLYEESGLLGVSGQSADVRVLEASGKARAAEALELFCFRAAREVAALCATLGGLDALVFTGGIGEHDAQVRAGVVQRLGFLGIFLDARENARHATRISRADGVPVLVLATDEERRLALHARRCLARSREM